MIWHQSLFKNIAKIDASQVQYIIIERSILSTLVVFAQNGFNEGRLTSWEYELLKKCRTVHNCTYDAIIMLNLDPLLCLDRIKRRQRDCETGIQPILLSNLDVLYSKLSCQVAAPTKWINVDATLSAKKLSQYVLNKLQDLN